MANVTYANLFPRFSLTASILRIVGALPAGPFRGIGACALFTVPFGAWAYAVSVRSSPPLLTWSSALGFSWLCAAPLFIWWGYMALYELLEHSRAITTEAAHEELKSAEIRLFLGWRHLFISVLLAPVCGLIAWQYATGVGRPAIQCYWFAGAFGALGFVSGIGFWAIMCTVRLIRTLCGLDLQIEFSHPDGFGGLRFLGSLGAKITALYFSGSLAIPFAMDVLYSAKVAHIDVLAYGTLVAFILVGLSCFTMIILRVHQCALDYKIRIDRESETCLVGLLKTNVLCEERQLQDVLRPLVYYTTYYSRIGGMKEYPFDVKTLIQLFGSVLMPIVTFAVDMALRHGNR